MNLSPDVRDFAQNLNTVYADGGGDYPESLNEGLHHALHSVEWRGSGAAQLIFLIAEMRRPTWITLKIMIMPSRWKMLPGVASKSSPSPAAAWMTRASLSSARLPNIPSGRFVFLTYEGPTNGGRPRHRDHPPCR